MIKLKTFLFAIVLFSYNTVIAQDDLLNLLDSAGAETPSTKVIATFKTTKIISAQTVETVKAKTMDFRVTHRFGNIGTESNGGGHTLFGLDQASDIRISFDFGITDKLMVGIGRSKQHELLDGLIKYRILHQTSDNKMPVSLAFYGNMGLSPERKEVFYSGTVGTEAKFIHRFSYVSQLILARKFSSNFSFQLLPTYVHRNFVKASINPDNGQMDQNGLFSLGTGFRYKITKRMAILADYFYTFSDYRRNNSRDKFYDPLAIGFEIETGGHVFHLNFTNAAAIMENNFIPYTTDDWQKGGFKFGFNISRVFNF